MANAKIKNKTGPVVELPECPVCLEIMSAPIFQCQSGHSLCHTCTKNLIPSICPLCRQTITQMRNWQLEDLISKATATCPYQASGCIYKLVVGEVENHIKECIFRVMACPLGIFGKCSWKGLLKEMLNHFKERHPQNIIPKLDQEVSIKNISITEDDRFVYIVPQTKYIFILTLKIDITQKLAYMVVQLIGSKCLALNHVYEINMSSLQDSRRKITFNDHCFNDTMDTNEIFRLAKCCVMPLNYFALFMNNEKMISFNLNVKKNQSRSANAKVQNTDPNQGNPNLNNKKPAKNPAKNPAAAANAQKAPGKKYPNKNKAQS